MRHFLVYNYSIAGVTDTCDNRPSGYECYEYAGDDPIECLMFSPGQNAIIRRPDKPETSGDWQWNGHEWVDISPPPPPPSEVTIPTVGNIPAEDVFTNPVARAILDASRTDVTLLAMLVELVAAWMVNKNHSDTIVPQIMERFNELNNNDN